MSIKAIDTVSLWNYTSECADESFLNNDEFLNRIKDIYVTEQKINRALTVTKSFRSENNTPKFSQSLRKDLERTQQRKTEVLIAQTEQQDGSVCTLIIVLCTLYGFHMSVHKLCEDSTLQV